MRENKEAKLRRESSMEDEGDGGIEEDGIGNGIS